MKEHPVLIQMIREKVPLYPKLPGSQKRKVLRQILSESINEILQKIRLPDPVEFRSMVMKEQFLDKRRRKGYRRRHGEINFSLWRLLYEAKQELKYNNLRTTQFEQKHVEGHTSPVRMDYSKTNTLSWEEPRISSASSLLSSINLVASNFEVDKVVQTMMVLEPAYASFVMCLDNICKSKIVTALGFAEFYLHEKRDLENPKWEKIVLDVKFYDKNFDKCMKKWEKLRVIIDKSIDKMKKYSDNKKKINELEKKFFIKLKI